jgi:soluble lytic murein transglycosylase-like protein
VALAVTVLAGPLLGGSGGDEWPEVRITRPDPAAAEPADGGTGVEIDTARVAGVDEELAARLEDEPEVLGTLVDAAATFDVRSHLVLALSWHESRWRPDAVSHAGAVGVMQVMPRTADRVVDDVDAIEPPVDLTDPAENVAIGTAYVGGLVERYDGDARPALQAYNQGYVTLERSGPLPSAAAFADRVLATADLLADADEGSG